MKLQGQRWLYRLGNAEVVVENAFSWEGWAQERWLINGEVAGETGGWLVTRRSFDEPWLTPLGDGVLAVEMRSRLLTVECRVTLDGVTIEPDALFEGRWHGKGVWPAADQWTAVPRFSVLKLLGLR